MFKSKIVRFAILILMPVALFAICSLITPGFGLNSISVVLSQIVIPVCLGYGIAFTNAAGIFDLSGGARVILAAACGASLAQNLGFGFWGMIIGCLAAGIVISIIMGFCHNLFHIPSLILSLGFVMLIEVAGARLLGDSSYLKVDSAITFIGKAPYKYIICVVMAILFYIIYYKTKSCYHMRLIGGNELLARNIGVNVKKANFQAYAISGIFLGVAGILQLCYSGTITSSVSLSSLSLVFQPMMGVLIGVELLALVDNLALTIVVGELFISILYNMIIGMGVDSSMQDVLLGFFMIIVMSISANKEVIGRFFRKLRRKEVRA